jgi:F-type H+-transporting ATPase subunit b
MRRLTAAAFALSLCPAAAFAESKMPQMDFQNPLTGDQVVWMVVILVVLYQALSRWGLPEIGKVLEHRAGVIARDLETARAAKAEADKAVAVLNAALKEARAQAQAEIATAVAEAKTQAFAQATALAAKLDAQLAESEAQIGASRAAAVAAIKPVAADTAKVILARITGKTPDGEALAPEIDAAFAALKAA